MNCGDDACICPRECYGEPARTGCESPLIYVLPRRGETQKAPPRGTDLKSEAKAPLAGFKARSARESPATRVRLAPGERQCLMHHTISELCMSWSDRPDASEYAQLCADSLLITLEWQNVGLKEGRLLGWITRMTLDASRQIREGTRAFRSLPPRSESCR
jgi:hypothetical protein